MFKLLSVLRSHQQPSRAESPRKHQKLRKRRLLLENLEKRQVMDGNANDLALLTDEFDDSNSIAQWSEVNHTEGWGPRGAQLEHWSVDANGTGNMLMRPHTVVWYQDWRGPLVFKEVTGDFVISTRMVITDRDDIGGNDGDNVPGDSLFSLGGLMIRTPRAITNGASDWVPGNFSNVGNVGENYVFLSMGYTQGSNNFSFEVKTTRNSNSILEISPLGTNPNEVDLQIARIGTSIITLRRLAGETDWTVHRRYTRDDMPETLQVGMVSYTDWNKASDFTPIVHNGSIIASGQIVDPTPAEPFNRDVSASFDYSRFSRPVVPAELENVDLVNSATNQQLLSFLGDNAIPTSVAPEITNFGADVAYTENGPTAPIASLANITDLDSINFQYGKLSVRTTWGASAQDRFTVRNTALMTKVGNQLSYNGTPIGSFAGGVGTETLVVTFNENVTPTIATHVLRNIVFSNASNQPISQRGVVVRIADGDGGISLVSSKTLNVVPTNDAPILNTAPNPTLPTIAEDVTNPAGTLVSSLILNAISDPDGAPERGIAIFQVDGGGTWQYSVDSGATWLNLTGVSSSAARLLAADASSMVRFVPGFNFNGSSLLRYRAWDQTQATAGGTVNIVSVGGTSAFSVASESASVTVTPVNDRPAIGNLNGAVNYAANSPAFVVAPNATVTDVDSNDFSSGRLRVYISGVDNASNRLDVSGAFSVNAMNEVFFNATKIGTRTTNGVGTNDLTIEFNANATKIVVQNLIRSITFRTVAGGPGLRNVRFNVTDGDGGPTGGLSFTQTRAVNVI